MSETGVKAALRAATSHLVVNLLSRLRDAEALPGSCESRVLETCLAFRALQLVGTGGSQRAALASFLIRMLSQSPVGGLDWMMIRGALGVRDSVPSGSVGVLRGFEHHSFSRKELLIESVCAVLGVVPFRGDFDIGLLLGERHAQWTRVALRAVKVLNDIGTDRRDAVTADDLGLLLRVMGHADVWEGYLLTSLLAVFALSQFPEYADATREVMGRVMRHQRPDGGLPVTTTTDVFCTAPAAIALHQAGTAPGTLDQMAGFLMSQQRPNGGWGYASGVHQTDVDTTSYVLQFLHGYQGEGADRAIRTGEDYLLGMAGPNGGFPTYVVGEPSEITMTAAALAALAYSRRPTSAAVLAAATEYIIARQRCDGGFERSWSLSESNSIFRVVIALHAASPRLPDQLRDSVRSSIASALRYLGTTQCLDGGWGQVPSAPSDVISTAFAIIALSHGNDRSIIIRGVRYLLDHQLPDGRFESIPDTVAPRPIPFDLTDMALVYPLTAFNHAATALTWSG